MGFYREQPRLLRTDTGSGAEAPRGSRLQSTGLPVFYYAQGFECFWFLEDPEEPPPLAEVVVPGGVALPSLPHCHHADEPLLKAESEVPAHYPVPPPAPPHTAR